MLSLKCLGCMQELAAGPPTQPTADYLLSLVDQHECEGVPAPSPFPVRIDPWAAPRPDGSALERGTTSALTEDEIRALTDRPTVTIDPQQKEK